jgi:alkylhydroperoxidase/carboxymuconolactone decarboxylase family protein YurZ
VSEILDRGIDLGDPDNMSADEVERFRASYRESHGSQLAAYEFWLEFDPSVVKRHRFQALHTPSPAGRRYPLPSTLGFLHLYAMLAYEEGIRYEVVHARHLGASRAAVLQTLELAFIQCGPRGMDAAWHGAAPVLREWGSDTGVSDLGFPPGWAARPDLFEATLSEANLSLDEQVITAIRSWYERNAGAVPAGVEFLAQRRPALLKAYWLRLAGAMRGPLPAQMLAVLELQTAVARVREPAIWSALRLARGLGVTGDQAAETIGWGMLYGGPEALSVAGRAFFEVYPEVETAQSSLIMAYGEDG